MGYYGSARLWCCRKLHTAKKNKKNSKEQNANKSRAESNVWIVVMVVRRLFLDEAGRLYVLYVFLLSSVMSLPSCAELCHRLKPVWRSLGGPTCLPAPLQPFHTALQPPALWLSRRLLPEELNGATSALLFHRVRVTPHAPHPHLAHSLWRRARGGNRWQREGCSPFAAVTNEWRPLCGEGGQKGWWRRCRG